MRGSFRQRTRSPSSPRARQTVSAPRGDGSRARNRPRSARPRRRRCSPTSTRPVRPIRARARTRPAGASSARGRALTACPQCESAVPDGRDRVVLEEEVVAAVPLDEAVGVVEPAGRGDETWYRASASRALHPESSHAVRTFFPIVTRDHRAARPRGASRRRRRRAAHAYRPLPPRCRRRARRALRRRARPRARCSTSCSGSSSRPRQRAPDELRLLDRRREIEPDWFQSERMIGYVCYVDRFAGDARRASPSTLDYLERARRHLPAPDAAAAAAARARTTVATRSPTTARSTPRLGTMDDLERARRRAAPARDQPLRRPRRATTPRREHEWARRRSPATPRYRDFYLLFPDRELPDAYERTLREVFPDFAPGQLHLGRRARRVGLDDVQRVPVGPQLRATPTCSRAMLEIDAATWPTAGVEVLRLDAVPFLWKRLGTDCENQPEVTTCCSQAFRALLADRGAGDDASRPRRSCPPTQLVPYLGAGDTRAAGVRARLQQPADGACSGAASPAGEATLMSHALRAHAADIPTARAWVTYVRCHDDIGWAVTDEDAAAVGLGRRRAPPVPRTTSTPGGSRARSPAGALFQDEPGDRRRPHLGHRRVALRRRGGARGSATRRRSTRALRRLAARSTPSPSPTAASRSSTWATSSALLQRPLATSTDAAHWPTTTAGCTGPPMDWEAAARRRDPGTLEGRVFAALPQARAARRSLPASCTPRPRRRR